MTIAVCLFLYSFVVVVLAPRLLLRCTRTGVAPRLGVAAWLAAIGSVVLSWLAAATLLVVAFVSQRGRSGPILRDCFVMLRSVALGRFGALVQVGLLTLAGLAALTVALLAVRLARALARTWTMSRKHGEMARLVGRRLPGLDAVVLDAPERFVYCVAGRTQMIVVTSATLDMLDERQLNAVLSHERAHLAGRHHMLIAITRGLARILPRVALFTISAAEIARLLEMCADDAAARVHGPRTVLGALLAISGAVPAPAVALGATGVDMVARAERLAIPPGPARRVRARLALTAVAIFVVTAPALTAIGLALCGSLGG
jgi:Zn-dependent protease with chaperone function